MGGRGRRRGGGRCVGAGVRRLIRAIYTLYDGTALVCCYYPRRRRQGCRVGSLLSGPTLRRCGSRKLDSRTFAARPSLPIPARLGATGNLKSNPRALMNPLCPEIVPIRLRKEKSRHAREGTFSSLHSFFSFFFEFFTLP